MEATEVFGWLEAIVVELVIRKVRSTVTMKAIGAELFTARFVFREEEFHTALLFLGELFFSGHGAIEFRIVAGKRQDVAFQSQTEFLCGHFSGAEGFFEIFAVIAATVEASEDGVEVGGHFEVILNRKENLFPEAGSAAVPEEARFPGHVENGHGISGAFPSLKAWRDSFVIAEGNKGIMAGGTRHGAVDGENGVEEESLTQVDSFRNERVVQWQSRHGEGAAHLERIGREFLGKVERSNFLGRLFVGRIADALNAESALQIGDE